MLAEPVSRKAVLTLSRNTLYEVHWQALRVSLLGTWMSPVSASDSIAALQTYVGDGTNMSRVWRVLNMLNAAIRGYYGTGHGVPEVLDSLKEFRVLIQAKYTALKQAGREFDYVSEETIRAAWPELERRTRAKIITNLNGRLKTHSKPGTRQELRWFLDIVKSMPL